MIESLIDREESSTAIKGVDRKGRAQRVSFVFILLFHFKP